MSGLLAQSEGWGGYGKTEKKIGLLLSEMYPFAGLLTLKLT